MRSFDEVKSQGILSSARRPHQSQSSGGGGKGREQHIHPPPPSALSVYPRYMPAATSAINTTLARACHTFLLIQFILPLFTSTYLDPRSISVSFSQFRAYYYIARNHSLQGYTHLAVERRRPIGLFRGAELVHSFLHCEQQQQQQQLLLYAAFPFNHLSRQN